MSELADLSGQVRDVALPAIKHAADQVVADWLAKANEFMEDVSGEPKTRFLNALRDAKDFRVMALAADTPEKAREYAEAHETAMRRVKTIMLAERIVVEQTTANVLMHGLSVALEAVAKVGKLILVTVVEGLVKGAIAGFTGGGGGVNVAGFFPGS